MPAAAAAETAPARAASGRHRIGAYGDVALVLLAIVAAWQAGSLLIGSHTLPGPVPTFAKLGAILSAPDFGGHAYETGRAFLTALVIALLGGLVLGLALGANRLAGEVAEPVLVALYAIPKITLYPVILLLFGLGISAKIAFGVLHGIIPVAVFTMAAVRSIRPVYFRASRAMRLSPLQTATRIVIPAARGQIFSGFRLGFALTLLGTLIGEMFASQRGIGYMLVKAMETNDVATVMALALLLITLATLASAALLSINRRLDPALAGVR